MHIRRCAKDQECVYPQGIGAKAHESVSRVEENWTVCEGIRTV